MKVRSKVLFYMGILETFNICRGLQESCGTYICPRQGGWQMLIGLRSYLLSKWKLQDRNSNLSFW